MSTWGPKYDIHRHPLLAFFVYPLYLLNTALMDLTGLNLVQFIIALILLFLMFYSFIFMMRICRDIIGLRNTDAALLSGFLFSCAYIMLTFIVPDHFAPSMFMLLMALYVCGVKIRDKKRLNGWQAVLMFIFTAGTTLSNGAKIVIDALFVEGKRFFRPKYLIFAIAIPCAGMWYLSDAEYRYYRLPVEQQRRADVKKASEREWAKNHAAFMDTTTIMDSAEAEKAFKVWDNKRILAKYRKDQKLPWNAHKGKPLVKKGMLQYTDMTTPRWQSLVDNVFGETIQLHQDYLLGDTLLPECRQLYRRGCHRIAVPLWNMVWQEEPLPVDGTPGLRYRLHRTCDSRLRSQRGIYHGSTLAVHNPNRHSLCHEEG